MVVRRGDVVAGYRCIARSDRSRFMAAASVYVQAPRTRAPAALTAAARWALAMHAAVCQLLMLRCGIWVRANC